MDNPGISRRAKAFGRRSSPAALERARSQRDRGTEGQSGRGPERQKANEPQGQIDSRPPSPPLPLSPSPSQLHAASVHWSLRPSAPLSLCASVVLRHCRRFHRDERGTISILTVVVILGLMMLMGLVLNVGRHIDDKVKMQNAADSSAYSGGVVLARGLNALAFSNHLLSDVFALTAFMREARDRNAEALVPDVLAAWSRIGPIFGAAEFPKFKELGPAITEKVPLEQELVRSYGELSAGVSQLLLPVLEYVLRERLIPEFQRAVVHQIPPLAQNTANELARRHGQKQPWRKQYGVLWRTTGQPAGYPDERNPLSRTLPAVDPAPGPNGEGPDPVPDPNPDPREGGDYQYLPEPQLYLSAAIAQRERLARIYLDQWNADRLQVFPLLGKMSNYYGLWRVFTCGQLMRLLNEEYPTSNLPHILRLTDEGEDPELLRFSENYFAINQYLDRDFMFLAIVYRPKFSESFNGMFKNPLEADPQAFAQVQLFVPRARLWYSPGGMIGAGGPGGSDGALDMGGGSIGVDVNLPIPVSNAGGSGGTVEPGWHREPWPADWSLFNQNWMVQLAPATTDSLVTLLQTRPPAEALGAPLPTKLPNLTGLTPREVRMMNTH